MTRHVIIFTIVTSLCFGTCVAEPWVPNNSGTGYLLMGVDFVDPNNGWAVGQEGTIIHTSDGGSSWLQQPNGGAHFQDLDFIDAFNGWAVGSGGTIIHTTNGGNSWTPQGETTSQLSAVCFIDVFTGWSVGDGGTIIHTTNSGLNWSSQNSGTLYYLNGVGFFDANNGWALGVDGTIRHTSDGGDTWENQTSGTSYQLYNVAFIDLNHGWIVGDNGTLLKTSDGGSTWTSQSCGTTAHLRWVGFPEPGIGWIVGSGGTILHTADGGSTWNQDTSSTTQFLVDASFVDVQHGWASGDVGTILQYHVEVRLPQAVIDSISPNPALEDSIVWFAGHGVDSGGTIIAYNWRSNISGQLSTQECFQTGALPIGIHMIYFKVQDDDSLWSPEVGRLLMVTDINQPPHMPHSPNPDSAAVGVFVHYDLSWDGGDPNILDTVRYDIYLGTENPPPLTASNSLETTYDTGALNASTTYFWGIVSHDNRGLATVGPIWSFTTAANSPPYPPSNPSPPDLATNVAITSSLTWTGGDPDSLDSITYDIYFGTCPTPELVATDLVNASYDPSALQISTLYCWRIVARDEYGNMTEGPLWHFSTGGMISPWIPQVSGVEHDIEAVTFLDSNTGWAVGGAEGTQGYILHTTDGGTTWVAQSSGTVHHLYDVAFVDANNGWAVGTVGTILHTTNGGAAWTAQNSGTANVLESVDFSLPSVGHIVGPDATTLRTTNGGSNWTAVTGNPYPHDVDFVNINYGLAVGGFGNIYRTIGGNPWSAEFSPTGEELLAVKYINSDYAWAVGNAGTILKRSPGGWTTQNSGTDWPLRSVDFLNTNSGWVAGWITILHTTNGGVNWTSEEVPYNLFGIDFVSENNGWAVGADGTILHYAGPVNRPATATIDSIAPNPSWQDSVVHFYGHGTDTDGTIIAYNWRSSLSGQMSTQSFFSTDILPVGMHLIYFKVQDDDSLWSPEVFDTLLVNANVLMAPVDVVISICDQHVCLNWNRVSGVAQYEVYHDTVSTGQFNDLIGIVPDTSYVDSNAVSFPQSREFYLIRSYRP